MDLLNVPVMLMLLTQPQVIRHPGSEPAFRDIHVPKLLFVNETLSKSHFPAQ
jgi:hypothetical protein